MTLRIAYFNAWCYQILSVWKMHVTLLMPSMKYEYILKCITLSKVNFVPKLLLGKLFLNATNLLRNIFRLNWQKNQLTTCDIIVFGCNVAMYLYTNIT